MPTAPSCMKIFASHDWGKQGANHARVAEVVSMLKDRGVDVWFDSIDMEGNIVQSMCDGIDGCDLVLVFVTANYLSKVQSANELDNVRREFMYAIQTKSGCMLAVRLEESLPRVWKGPVGMILGANLYNDLRVISDSSVDALVSSIRRKVNTNAWKHTTLECLGRTALKVAACPREATTGGVPSVRTRVRKARDLLGLTVNESDHTRELVDRLFESVVKKSARHDGASRSHTMMDKLERIEVELGISR